jgi:hypothetical protein
MKLIEDKFTNKPWSRQLKAYHRKAASGHCVTCKKSRGKSPTLECRKCTVARSERRRRARQEAKKHAAKSNTK